MVYRKLHQNVGTFRVFLNEWAKRYGAGDDYAREKLAAKFIGRWRMARPSSSRPTIQTRQSSRTPSGTSTFSSVKISGIRCPVGAHVRRTNPRDAFGFQGALVHRRRISRRGLPYGPVSAGESARRSGELDKTDRGIVFMALNASLSRQFEFVQQQWISYGNDAHLGNEKDLLIAHHGEGERFGIQGDTTAANPPFFCSACPTSSSCAAATTSSAQHHRARHARHEPCRPTLDAGVLSVDHMKASLSGASP